MREKFKEIASFRMKMLAKMTNGFGTLPRHHSYQLKRQVSETIVMTHSIVQGSWEFKKVNEPVDEVGIEDQSKR